MCWNRSILIKSCQPYILIKHMESGIRRTQLPFALHDHSENLEKSQNSKKKPKFVLQMLKDKHYYIRKAKDFSIPLFSNSHMRLVFVHRLVSLGHAN